MARASRHKYYNQKSLRILVVFTLSSSAGTRAF
jgi:hypothetical protein